MGQEHGHPPEVGLVVFAFDELANAELVLGVEIGEQEADDEAAYSLIHQIVQLLQEILFVQRAHQFAGRANPFFHANGERLRDQWLRLVDPRDIPLLAEREAVRPLACASDEKGVLKP